MPLIDLQAPPSPSMRRWFGLSLGLLLIIASFLISDFGHWLNSALLVTGLVVVTVYYAWPTSQQPIIRGWQHATYPIAFCVGHLLLGTIYFFVLTPIALMLRTTGHDPLNLQQEGRSSNWNDRQSTPTPDQYFKQF
ncbi:SxtJ family membrane protein [Rhodopirellula islandica]|nr:SxtJ family membrane protein [Rhodopirellula islandica]